MDPMGIVLLLSSFCKPLQADESLNHVALALFSNLPVLFLIRFRIQETSEKNEKNQTVKFCKLHGWGLWVLKQSCTWQDREIDLKPLVPTISTNSNLPATKIIWTQNDNGCNILYLLFSSNLACHLRRGSWYFPYKTPKQFTLKSISCRKKQISELPHQRQNEQPSLGFSQPPAASPSAILRSPRQGMNCAQLWWWYHHAAVHACQNRLEVPKMDIWKYMSKSAGWWSSSLSQHYTLWK